MARRLVETSLLKLLGAPEHFDAAFYASHYPDLAGLGPLALLRHYRAHGRAEGRFGSLKDMLARARHADAALPAGFSSAGYRAWNPDIRETVTSEIELLAHFIEFGREEGRRYSELDAAFYRDLYHPDWIFDIIRLDEDWQIHKGAGRYGSWRQMVEAHGFREGPWIELIQPAEFRLLNPGLVADGGEIGNAAQAGLAFVREGWRRLAPLALGLEFDPDYYRELHPELAHLEAAELYRAWLLEGVPEREAPSGRMHLKRLGLPPERYPEAFAWSAFAAAHPGVSGRWQALERLIADGFPPEGLGADFEADPQLLLGLAGGYAMAGDDGSSLRALAIAEQHPSAIDVAHQHRGDSYFRLRLWREALDAYEPLLERPDAAPTVVSNSLHCALRLGQHERAFAILASSKSRLQGEAEWRAGLINSVQATFDVASFQALQSYAGDRVAEGDHVLLEAISRIAGHLDALSPALSAPPAPLPASADGRVVILANQDLRQCTHYRVEQKAELFDALGRPCQIFDRNDITGFVNALPGAVAAIFYRQVAFPDVIEAILAARALAIPTYYEIDDLIFDSTVYPPPLETYGGQISKTIYDGLRYGAPLTRAAMALCDYAIASTRPLAEQMAPLVRSGRSFVIRNGLDSRNADMLEGERPARDPGQIRIFYGSGTLAHNSDFLELAGPALLDLMAADPRVKLVIVGHLALDEPWAAFADRIERVGFIADARAYWALLATADINLAVLEPGLISDCKSEIKWLEAAVFGTPSIVSATATYRDMLEDGVDVLMAEDVASWRGALDRLVADRGLRERIGAAAKAKARALYGLEAGARSLAAALDLADRAAAGRPKPSKPRILLANVYFAPQSIGGATRVVQDNVDSWMTSGVADRFDFAVATTDHGAKPPYRSRVESYRGLPVFRMSTPIQANMDWRPFDPAAGAVFAAYLDAWRPDLVHFHASQRLTASCLEACRDAGVPYLVTVHDAWWISDWMFLVDDDGFPQAPMQPLHAPTRTGLTPAQSRTRLERLGEALRGAEAILAVSDSFADLYRRAGFDKVVSTPNGLSRFEPSPRRASPSGRVRLGLLGGMSIHKGYHLIYAALTQGAFANLELTVVDHSPRWSPERQVWGTTPVTLVGRTPQSEIQDLYAALDVLLAPSIWPESYGLVTREALAAGLWVIAGDQGAIGEDVTPGVNGFVIDVSSPAGLAGALAEIDRDPARYLRPPERRPALRTADQQAAELAELYARLTAAAGRAAPTPVEAAMGVRS